MSKRSTFFLVVPLEPRSLDEHLQMLFVMAAVGRLWPDVYRCAECQRFNVHRKRPTGTRYFCVGDDACRRRARATPREIERRKEHESLRALLDGQTDWLVACRKLGRSSRYCDALVRSFEGERGR